MGINKYQVLGIKYQAVNIMILVPCVLYLLSSCSLQKRLYNKGFYVSKHHTPTKPTDKPNTDTLPIVLANVKPVEAKEFHTTLTVEASAKKGVITYLAPTTINLIDGCDTLILKNGTVILTKISEVYPDRVTYRFCNAPDEPLRTINRTDLRHIVYANGNKETVANCDIITLKNGTVIPTKIISIYTGKIKFRSCSIDDKTISTVNKDDVAYIAYTDETINMLRNSGSDIYTPVQSNTIDSKKPIEHNTNGFAIAGIVISIANIFLSLVFLIIAGLSTLVTSATIFNLTTITYFLLSIPSLLALLALIFSIIALIQISRSQEFQKGLGMAIVGIVLSVIVLLALIAALAAI